VKWVRASCGCLGGGEVSWARGGVRGGAPPVVGELRREERRLAAAPLNFLGFGWEAFLGEGDVLVGKGKMTIVPFGLVK